MNDNTQRTENSTVTSIEAHPGKNASSAESDVTDTTPVERRVTVIMPFLSGDPAGERRSILNYMRIKYIVENMVEVTPLWCKSKSDRQYLNYKVNVFKTGAGEIAARATKEIVDAHLIIALINEVNVNVVYELAIRHLLKESLIIVKDIEKGKNAVPVYLQDFAHIDYRGSSGSADRAIINEMEYLANQGPDKVQLDWELPDDYPAELIDLIKTKDTRLTRALQSSIQDFEDEKIEQPSFIRDIATVVHPSRAFSSWATISPYSVIRILWKKKRTKKSYDIQDMLEPPVITCCNNAFLRMLNRSGDLPDPRGDQKLTAKTQLEYLRENMDSEAYVALERDQGRVFASLFLRDELTHALVPVQFNDTHNREFTNRAFLPCLFGKKIVGDESSPHYAYFVVCFVESFHSISELKHMPQHSELFAAPDEPEQQRN